MQHTIWSKVYLKCGNLNITTIHMCPIPELLALIWKWLQVSSIKTWLYSSHHRGVKACLWETCFVSRGAVMREQIYARLINISEENLGATAYKDILYSWGLSDSVFIYMGNPKMDVKVRCPHTRAISLPYLFSNIGKWLICGEKTDYIIEYSHLSK